MRDVEGSGRSPTRTNTNRKTDQQKQTNAITEEMIAVFLTAGSTGSHPQRSRARIIRPRFRRAARDEPTHPGDLGSGVPGGRNEVQLGESSSLASVREGEGAGAKEWWAIPSMQTKTPTAIPNTKTNTNTHNMTQTKTTTKELRCTC